jgi:hypothetical protein
MFFPVVAPLEASKACAGLANAPEIAGSAGNLTSAKGHGVGTVYHRHQEARAEDWR